MSAAKKREEAPWDLSWTPRGHVSSPDRYAYSTLRVDPYLPSGTIRSTTCATVHLCTFTPTLSSTWKKRGGGRTNGGMVRQHHAIHNQHPPRRLIHPLLPHTRTRKQHRSIPPPLIHRRFFQLLTYQSRLSRRRGFRQRRRQRIAKHLIQKLRSHRHCFRKHPGRRSSYVRKCSVHGKVYPYGTQRDPRTRSHTDFPTHRSGGSLRHVPQVQVFDQFGHERG